MWAMRASLSGDVCWRPCASSMRCRKQPPWWAIRSSPMCWAPAAAVFSLSAWSRSVAATACGTGRRIGFRIHSASPPAEGGSGRKRENAASNKVQGMLQSEEPALCAAKRQHTGLVFDRSCLFCQSRGVVTSFCALSKAEAVNTLSRISWSASVLFSLAIGVESA